MVDGNLYSDPRVGDRRCKCGEIKILSHAFCGGHICRTKSKEEELRRIRQQQIALQKQALEEERIAREKKIEEARVAREKKIERKRQLKEEKAAKRKRGFRLNTMALKSVLENSERERDAEAKELINLQRRNANQSLIDKQIKKYQSAIRTVKKAQADLSRHKRGLQ